MTLWCYLQDSVPTEKFKKRGVGGSAGSNHPFFLHLRCICLEFKLLIIVSSLRVKLNINSVSYDPLTHSSFSGMSSYDKAVSCIPIHILTIGFHTFLVKNLCSVLHMNYTFLRKFVLLK